jgi:hypothetical protein
MTGEGVDGSVVWADGISEMMGPIVVEMRVRRLMLQNFIHIVTFVLLCRGVGIRE